MARSSRKTSGKKESRNGAESLSDFHADLLGVIPRFVRAKSHSHDKLKENLVVFAPLINPFELIREYGSISGTRCG